MDGKIGVKEIAMWSAIFFSVGIAANLASEYIWDCYKRNREAKLQAIADAKKKAAANLQAAKYDIPSRVIGSM